VEDVPARLVVTRGPQVNEEYNLTQVEVTLGRSAGNAIILAAPEISRRHAVIFFRGDRHHLEDLGSTNGTFVNGRRLSERVILADGDKIQFGESILMQYHSPGAPTQVVSLPPGQAALVPESSPPPSAAVAAAPANEIPTPAPAAPIGPANEFIVEPDPQVASQKRWVLGCGCLPVVLLALCLGSLFVLDAYQQGSLLYCGPLRPFFEILLGPFGFNPLCAVPI